MSWWRRLFGNPYTPHATEAIAPEKPAEPEVDRSKLPQAIIEELEANNLWMRAYTGYIRAERQEGGRLYFQASWASKFKLATDAEFIGGKGEVPGRWVLSSYGLTFVNTSALPPLYAAVWPKDSILIPSDPRAKDAAVPDVSFNLSVSPEVIAVARTARGVAQLDDPDAARLRDLLAPSIADLCALPDSMLIVSIYPSGSSVDYSIYVYWAWREGEPSIAIVARLIDQWRERVAQFAVSGNVTTAE